MSLTQPYNNPGPIYRTQYNSPYMTPSRPPAPTPGPTPYMTPGTNLPSPGSPGFIGPVLPTTPSAPSPGTGGGTGGSGGYVPPSSGGQPTGGQPTGGISVEQQAAIERENRIRGNIESAHGQYTGQLDSLLGWLPEQQQLQMDTIGTTASNMLGGIQNALNTGKQKIAGYREDIDTRSRDSASKVAESLRNMLKASTMQIGSMGGGDSSATEKMLPYAYSKLAARERGGVQRQANQQQFDLDQKSLDLQQVYEGQKNEIEQWKGTSFNAIRDKFLPMIANLREQKARAPLDKANALNALEERLMSDAINNIRQIEAEARAYTRELDSWARERSGQLTGMQGNLGQASSYNVQDMAFNTMPSAQIGQAGGVGGTYNPYTATRRRNDEQYA